MDVAAWLSRLGLEQYEPAFLSNDVDADVLPELTAEDLTSLGVTSIGHRRKLLAAIAALRADAAPAPDAQPSASSATSAGAERRQLTVMFCDLVGSTALSARFDPEDLRELIAAYHAAVTEAVAGADGFIARYMGDGVLAYFGYPQAHEDDAERAVRAGLAAIEAVGRLDVKSVKLETRVGIATGLVVVGDLIGEGAAQEQNVVGETPNLAARLQAIAEPNSVVISEGTHRLLGGLFEYRDLGAVELKGVARLVSTWQVLRPSVVASRFEALRGTALTRLVGRDEEIELLLRRWARAKAGDGQVLLVSGEAGIGKSRIVATVHERLAADSAICLRYFCSPYYQDSPLFPFIEQLGRAAGFARDDPAEVKLEKVEALAMRAQPAEGDIALLADLLSLPASSLHPLPELSPQRKKERTFEALVRQLEGLSRRRPVLVVLEDAHWIDPTSRELLDLAVERVRSLPVLLVVTCRPEFQPLWIGQSRVAALTLNRLDRSDRTALVLQVAEGKALPDEVVDQIVDRTDGVPLFVEELTKSVLESGFLREESDRYVLDRALPPFAIPTSLHDSLMARLDRLASVRHVAQIGAAIGREFSYALLHAVTPLSEAELQAALARLVASELVSEHGAPPDAVYVFKHALVQDAAHASLLRSTRQQLHAQIAEALEAHSPELMDSRPELLAQHYAEAGRVANSVEYWGKAGRRSAARSAMAESAAQYRKGLDQLALLPETPERQRRELEFWTALGTVLFWVKGQAAPETGHAFARARELWERLGSPSEFLRAPYGEASFHVFRGELEAALRLDESLLRLSRERKHSAGLILGHFCLGRDLMFAGRFAPSRSHLEDVLALYDPEADRSLVDQTGFYPHVNAQGLFGIILFCLGYPEQSLAYSRAAVAEARRLGHHRSLAISLTNGATLRSLLGEDVALNELLDQVIAVTTEQGFPVWHAQATTFRGWLQVRSGDVAGGIQLLTTGLSAYRATGAEAWLSHHLALLAEARETAGQMEEAAALYEEALQIVEQTKGHWFTAELNRRKGDLRMRQGDIAAAEALFRKAFTIAEEQQARLWQLRAATSLSELHRHQGREGERGILASIYDWFSEGFETQDLTRARALLSA